MVAERHGWRAWCASRRRFIGRLRWGTWPVVQVPAASRTPACHYRYWLVVSYVRVRVMVKVGQMCYHSATGHRCAIFVVDSTDVDAHGSTSEQVG